MPGTPKLTDLVTICLCCWTMTALCMVEMPAAWMRELSEI